MSKPFSKPYKIFRTEAHQTVRWTHDSATAPSDYVPMDVSGPWTCSGCGGRGRGTLIQAEGHARQCWKTSEEGSR